MKKLLSLILGLAIIMSMVLSVSAIKAVPIKSISLDKASLTLIIGKTYNLKVTLNPTNTTQKSIKYSTSNKNVAVVDAQGKIKAVAAGKAVISVISSVNAKITAKCNVTVIKDPYDPNEKVELTVWSSNAGVYKDGQQPGDYVKENLIPEWNKKFPNVKINANIIPWDNIQEKITVAFQSKTLPDVYFDSTMRILSYANMGAVENLNDIIPQEDLPKFLSNKTLMDYCSIDGKNLVSMPYMNSGTMLILNKTLWEKAGAANLLPQDEYRTWTLAEFKTALKAVANKDKGVYGLTLFALNEQGDQLYNNIMSGASGKDLFTADTKKYVAADNPEAVKVMEWFKSLVDEGLVTPHPESLSANDAWEYFKQGKNGMCNGGASHPDVIKSGLSDGSIKAPFNYTFVNYPTNKKGTAISVVGYGQDCAFKTGDATKVKWAKRFLLWNWTETDIRYAVAKCFNSTGKPQSWVNSDDQLMLYTKLISRNTVQRKYQATFGIKGYSEMRAAMFPEMQSMFINMTTPKQTLTNIQKKINAIIAKYNN